MGPIRAGNRVAAYALALTGALFMFAAGAQTQIYKWTGTDGVTSYSQTPPAEGKGRDVQTITVETLPPEQQQAARRMLAHMESKANAQAATIRNRYAQADRNVEKALQNLQRAESELRRGSQTKGSDFIANVGGGVRLREGYFQRVAALEAKAKQARQALDDAYSARNAAR
jgi:hypothetical protein